MDCMYVIRVPVIELECAHINFEKGSTLSLATQLLTEGSMTGENHMSASGPSSNESRCMLSKTASLEDSKVYSAR